MKSSNNLMQLTMNQQHLMTNKLKVDKKPTEILTPTKKDSEAKRDQTGEATTPTPVMEKGSSIHEQKQVEPKSALLVHENSNFTPKGQQVDTPLKGFQAPNSEVT